MQSITEITISPVKPGNTTNVMPEWGRLRDLERLFGIRRGTAYALMRDNKIRSCLVRVQGRVSGLRLIHLQSVRDFIVSQMTQEDERVVVE